MARQSGVSTPIFDELLREMTEGTRLPAPPPPLSGEATPETNTPAPRRRRRAD
jgi:hypothetical protein